MRQPHKKLYMVRNPRLDAALTTSILLLAATQYMRVFTGFFLKNVGPESGWGIFLIYFVVLILSMTAVWASWQRPNLGRAEQALRRKRFKIRRELIRRTEKSKKETEKGQSNE